MTTVAKTAKNSTRASRGPRRTRARVAARPAEKRLQKATETLPEFGPGGERIRPSHWRYSRAKLALCQRGVAPTYVALAKELTINRVTLHKYLRRYPWLDAWVDGQARQVGTKLFGAIQQRMGMMAIQGSVPAAIMYCQMETGIYSRREAGLTAEDPTAHLCQVNILVPCPEMPNGGTMPQQALTLVQPSTSVLPANIPRLCGAADSSAGAAERWRDASVSEPG